MKFIYSLFAIALCLNIHAQEPDSTIHIDTLDFLQFQFFDGEINAQFENAEHEVLDFMIQGDVGIPINNSFSEPIGNLLEPTDFGSIQLYDTPNNQLIDRYKSKTFIVSYEKEEYFNSLVEITYFCPKSDPVLEVTIVEVTEQHWDGKYVLKMIHSGEEVWNFLSFSSFYNINELNALAGKKVKMRHWMSIVDETGNNDELHVDDVSVVK